MRKISGLLCLSLLAAGYATTGWTASSEERLNFAEENQRVLERRVTRVEERLTHVENELGNTRQSSGPTPAASAQTSAGSGMLSPAPADTAAPAPAKSSRRSAAEAAPPQETGFIMVGYPTLAPSPNLTLAKARGVDPLRNPLALGQEYSGPALADSPAANDPTPVPVNPAPAASGPVPSGMAGSAASFIDMGDVTADNGPSLEPPAPSLGAPAPAAPQKASRSAPATGKGPYDAALALYYKGEYSKALEAFKAFLQSAPGSSLAPNAMYWEGECQYSLGKHDQAIMIFKDVVTKYPKHDKAAASLLKAGYAYERMKDMDNARFYWQILLDDFPNSAPANLARKRLGAG